MKGEKNMERQYVGARYVPKVYKNPDDGSAYWKANVEYEALTIVVANNGDSYTSRKAVPRSVGAPQDNPEYWAKTGDFNASLLALQNRMLQAENDIDTLETQNGNETLETTAQTLSGAVNELDNRVDSLEAEVYDYIVWIGDSYTGAASLGDDREKRYSTRVSTMLGLIEKNYAVGGCGFIIGPTPYLQQVANAVSDFDTNNLNKNKVKYFVIGGSANDLDQSTDITSYVSAVKAVYDDIVENFPKAQIIVIPLLYRADLLPRRAMQYLYGIKYAAAGYSEKIRIIDHAWEWMSGNYIDILYQSGVNVHWNVAGHLIVARYVYSAIMGNEFSPSAYYEFTGVNWNGTYVTTDSGKLAVTKINHKIEIEVAFTAEANHTGNFTLCNLSASNLYYLALYWWGNKQITGTFKPQVGEAVDFAIYSTVTKTGDTSGSRTVQVDVCNGSIVAGKKYVGKIVIDNGIMPNDVTFQ